MRLAATGDGPRRRFRRFRKDRRGRMRAGRTFTGWFTATTGGTKVTAASVATAAAARTLYAQWAQQTVTFDANGGECATATAKFTRGGTYGTLPVAALDGRDFAGWFTEAEGGERVEEGGVVTDEAARTLYAHWTLPGAGMTGRIAGISVAGKSAGAQRRAAGCGEGTCVLVVETEVGAEYKLQWTPALGGEWETVLSWVATEEESEVEVPMAAEERMGFFRLVQSAGAGAQ